MIESAERSLHGSMMMSKQLYDQTDPLSIEAYAKRLIGHTFRDVLEKRVISDNEESIETEDFFDIPDEGSIKKRTLAEQEIRFENRSYKGGLGNLLEEEYFGYTPNNKSEADFSEAGVELKATPYEYTTANTMRAGERLVLTMINYNGPIEESLYDSHLWRKCKVLLLIFYWRNRELQQLLDYKIQYVSLFTPPKRDLIIIEKDYRYIADKIRSGKAEELSESDTFYLGACTKGATALSSIVPQFYPPHTPAKKRAFCYKISYMTFVLNEYIISGTNTYESIIKDEAELEHTTFADCITTKINRYRGKTDKQLCAMFDREYNNNKGQWVDITYRMLGIKNNRAEEFKKANIATKVIRLEEDGNMRECMSFPPFKYKELVTEEWEDSTLHNYFEETKFLFVIFKRSGEHYVLRGCQLWNMPYHDLNVIVRDGWQKVVDTIKDGVTFEIKNEKDGNIKIKNNLPKKSDNPIVHVRPHATQRYYEFTDGRIIGDGTRADANQLPDGTWMPHYSFWINNDYIESQISPELK